MKKSIFFLAASAIMFAMGSCTNDVLDNVQQVDYLLSIQSGCGQSHRQPPC